jgi:phosphoglycerate dehydrogenase-like enzyme
VKILIHLHSPFAVWNIPPGHVARLRERFPAHEFLLSTSDEDGLHRVPDAEVAFSSQITREQFLAAPRLRWIHSPSAGIGGMLFPELVASPVVLTNSRGMAADTMAEHVLAVTLALFRRLPDAWRSQEARQWAQDAIGLAGTRTIAGTRVLVIGLGAIGTAVATRMAALGAEVAGIRRREIGPAPAGVARVAGPGALPELLGSADVVVLSAPHTRETRRMIGVRELAAMSRDAVLVNVSRGGLVDEAALADALACGRIAGAALDVFQEEPLPPDSPFWTLRNVLITPHTSGFRPDHWDAAIGLFGENLRRFEAGAPLLNVVDKRAGY